MQMFCRCLVACISLLIGICCKASPDSSHLRISLLTCSPGEALYSTFGHSALRVIDSLNNDDIVYNYGTFNFEEPGFYTKFIRGKLNYYLSTSSYDEFKSFYADEGRGITEQVLNLGIAENVEINKLLHQNLLSENRFYKYDFLFDNCTTRLRDLVETASANQIVYNPVLVKPATFRNLIHEYLDKYDHQWSKLGIDLLLGSRTDAIMKPREIMFLPDYLMYSFDKVNTVQKPLVSETLNVLSTDEERIKTNSYFNPIPVFTVLFLFLSIPSFYQSRSSKVLTETIDRSVFFITGLIGILIIFMWLGTDHLMCRDNYNLLWAFPGHIYAAFHVATFKNSHKMYFRLFTFFYLVLLGAWFFLPQNMNVSFIPVTLFLLYRCFDIGFKKHASTY